MWFLPVVVAVNGTHGNPMVVWIPMAIMAVVLVLVLAVLARVSSLWLQAYMARAPIPMFELIGMWLRKANPRVIVRAKIMATQAGLDIDTRTLESHCLAGGSPEAVVRSLIAAQRGAVDLTFGRAAAIDLAGRDVVAAVRNCITPIVIDAPDPGKGAPDTFRATAKDGVELKVRARVTLRVCLDRLVGGSSEETVVARVGQAIGNAIRAADSHVALLDNREAIGQAVLASGVDRDTGFEILSVKIVHIAVG